MTASSGRRSVNIHSARAFRQLFLSHLPTPVRRLVRSLARRSSSAVLGSSEVLAHPLHSIRLGWGSGLRSSFPAYAQEIRRRTARIALATAMLGGVSLTCRGRVASRLWTGALASLVLSQRNRERARRGRQRRWPPGRLTNQPVMALRADALIDSFARFGPVVKTSAGTRRVAAVLGLAEGAKLLSEHRDTLGSIGYPISRLIDGRFIRDMEGADHLRHRKLLAIAFGPSVVAAAEPRFRAAVDDALEAVLRSGESIRVGPFLERLVFRTWFDVFFGFAPSDEDHDHLRRAFDQFEPRLSVTASPAERLAFATAADLIREQVSRWRCRDPSEWPVCSASEVLRLDASAFDDETLFGNLLLLLRTSSADLHGLATWTLSFLTERPELIRRIRGELMTGEEAGEAHLGRDTTSLAARVVSETVRLQQSEAIHRRITADIEHRGNVLPAGWELRVCVLESHRDPTVFADPDHFDPDRFLGRTYTRTEYAPFGLDGHGCLGEGLTRMSARVIAEAFASKAEWGIGEGHAIVFGQWRHWAPDPRWSIRLRRAEGSKPACPRSG